MPNYNSKRRHALRAGMALMDTLLAVGILTIMSADLASSMGDITERQRAVQIASTMNSLVPLAKTYMDQNYTALTALIPAQPEQSAKPVAIPISGQPLFQNIGDLASSSGRLPASYQPNLPSGQKIVFMVKHIASMNYKPEHLEGVLVTVGGNPLSDKAVGLAAMRLEGLGGGVYHRSYGSQQAGTMIGVSGSWSEIAGNWQAPAAQGVGNADGRLSYGHIGTFLTGGQGTQSPYLNRYNIGNPEANKLHAIVDVNSNDLDNIRTLTGVNTMRYTGTAGAVNTLSGINTCLNNVTGCGISISDDGGIYDMNDRWMTIRMSDPNFGLHVQGRVKAENSISTTDAYQQDTTRMSPDGNIWAMGNVQAGGLVQGTVIRATYTAKENDPCENIEIGDGTVTQAGDWARDTAGTAMSCVNGKWAYTAGKQFATFDGLQCGINQGTNNTTYTQLSEGDDRDNTDTSTFNAYVGGQYETWTETYQCGHVHRHHHRPLWCQRQVSGWVGATQITHNWVGANNHGQKALSATWVVPPGQHWWTDLSSTGCFATYH